MSNSYAKLVEEKCVRNPCLKTLHNFLLSSSDPHEIRVISLDFTHTDPKPLRREVHPSSLADELSPGQTKGLAGQILLVENISAAMIEELGSSLMIDPMFFASHVHSSWREFEAQAPKFCELPSRIKRQKFATFSYHRSLLFPNIDNSDYKLLRQSNIRRKVIVFPPIQGHRIGLAQHCCSVLVVERKSNTWLGLVLVDPPIKSTYISIRKGYQVIIQTTCKPLLGGPEDFLPINCSVQGTLQASSSAMLDELVHYWELEQLAHFDPRSSCAGVDALAYYPLRIIASEWVNYLAAMCFSLRQYDYSPSATASSPQDLQSINAALRTLPSWPRRVISSTTSLRSSIYFIKHHSRGQSQDWLLLLEDYEHIAVSIVEHGKQLEAMIPLVTAYLQLAESRRTFSETRNVSRLTILALVFVPLSFVTGLFSMNEAFGPGGPKFWIYFVVAVPILSLVFWVAKWRQSALFSASKVPKWLLPLCQQVAAFLQR